MKTKLLIVAIASMFTLPTQAYLVVSGNNDELGTKCYSEDSGTYARILTACTPSELFDDTVWDYPCPEYLEDLGANDCIAAYKNGITYVCMPRQPNDDPCVVCPSLMDESQYIPNWTSMGNNRVYKGTKYNYTLVKQDSYTCKAVEVTNQPELEYGCAANYYTTAASPSASMTCLPCPSSGKSAIGNTAITGCYVPANTPLRDSTGTYKYTSDCHYSK